jgi:prefoldin subunit 5
MEEEVRSLRREIEDLRKDLEDARAMKKTLLAGGSGGGGGDAQKLVQLQTRLSAKERELKESQDEMDTLITDLLKQKASLSLEIDKLTAENNELKSS